MSGRGAASVSPREHAWPGWLLAAVLALLGAFLVTLALAPDLLPVFLRPTASPADEPRTQGLLALAGAGLLGVAWGVLSFRRWAWWGAVAVGLLLAWPALSGLLGPLAGGSFRFRPLELVVAGCLPYLWARRRSFGIGPTPPDPAREP